MRITGGLARGIVLDVPKKGEVRPATDFVRERIFGRLATAIQDAYVLDCFAGTGAYGLEALSRGAKQICFLEKDPNVVVSLQNNCEKVCKSAQKDVHNCTRIITTDVFHFDFSRLESPVNYVFFDPPYRFWEENLDNLLCFFEKFSENFPEAQMVVEYPSQFAWTEQIPWKPIYPLDTHLKTNAPGINLFRKR